VESAPASEQGGVQTLPLGRIRKSPWQPRQVFDEESLDDLVSSVKERGVLQPLLVREIAPDDGGANYELIAGERRLRAASKAQLTEVPAIIMEVSDEGALEIALVENLQREDLNIIEEAEGYTLLAKKFNLNQEEVARRVGKGRATIANATRLLSLPDTVKQLLAEDQLSAGHAKVLLGLAMAAEQDLLAHRCVKEGLSVRALEGIVNKVKRAPKKARAAKSDIPQEHLKFLTQQLHQQLGAPVHLHPCQTLANGKKKKGSIQIDFFSNDELDRLLVMLGISDDL
jgi:ParB family chromosome partitioning protein